MLAVLLAASLQTATMPPAIVTGSDVVRICSSATEWDEAYCRAYIAGVNDSIVALMEESAEFQFKVCLPERMRLTQVVRDVTGHLAENEDYWGFKAAGAVIVAMGILYPCDD